MPTFIDFATPGGGNVAVNTALVGSIAPHEKERAVYIAISGWALPIVVKGTYLDVLAQLRGEKL